MDYTPFRMSGNIDDRRNELDVADPIRALLGMMQSPMMAHGDEGPEPPITALGKQAGMLDIAPSHRAWQLERAKAELAELIRAQLAGARGFDEVMDPNGPPVRLDRRLDRRL